MSATRIYANPWLARRMNASIVVVAGAFMFGCFEVWRAVNAGPEGAGAGYLFAALFLGGGFYAARQILIGNTDTVVALDVEWPGDNATIVLWRPFASKRIVGPLVGLTDWRPYGKQVRRNVRVPMVLADHPEHPRPLEFEIGPGMVFGEEFRALAGEALAALEKPADAGGLGRA